MQQWAAEVSTASATSVISSATWRHCSQAILRFRYVALVVCCSVRFLF